MTPQEKAKELYNKYADEFNFDDTYRSYREQSKQCALIAVNEIIESRKSDPDFDDTKLGIVTHYIAPHPLRLSYWVKVKEEIQEL